MSWLSTRIPPSVASFFVAACLVAGCNDSTSAPDHDKATSARPRGSYRTKFNALVRAQSFDAAEQLIIDRLSRRPDDLEAQLLAARLSVHRDDLAEADRRFAQYVDAGGTVSDPLLKEWMLLRCEAGGVMAAIEYLEQLEEKSTAAHRLAAQLRTIVGDLHGANRHYRALLDRDACDSGDLMAMATVMGRYHKQPGLIRAARQRYPNDFRPELAAAMDAWLAEEPEQAWEIARRITDEHPDFEPAVALATLLLVEDQRWDRLGELLSRTDRFDHRHPWIQYGRGMLHVQRENGDRAAACLARSVMEGAHSFVTTQLAQTLARCGESELAADAAKLASRQQALRIACRSLFKHPDGSQAKAFEIGHHLCLLGRREEAIEWWKLASTLTKEPSPELERSHEQHLASRAARAAKIDRFRRRLEQRFPEDQDVPLPAKLDEWSMSQELKPTSSQIPPTTTPVVLVDEAEQRGLIFTYRNGEPDGRLGRWIYQTMGGGIGVGDFDLNGWPDVYLVQSGGRPDQPREDAGLPSDVLYWNRDGHFHQGENHAPRQTGYGQGVAVGDVNDDGFPDLYVANIGSNRLLINRGDGTFVDRTKASGLSGTEWTTSVCVADVNADGWSDLIDVNYCRVDTAVSDPCHDADGEIAVCLPVAFAATPDRLWLGTGDGTFRESREFATVDQPGRGMGILVADLDDRPGVEVFVANDMSNNHFWVRSSGGPWREQAIIRGLATGDEGRPQACMGIASADWDEDGDLDLVVTNYANESNACYQQQAAGNYRDRAVRTGMQELSYPMLGFGTVLTDFNGDGRYDLFVANGLVTRNSGPGEAFRQPAQMIHWSGDRWVSSGHDIGKYFEATHTGRAVCLGDFDRDLRADLLIGHLDEPVSALMNHSQHATRMALQLVATRSARDAVGAEVVVTTDRGVRSLQRSSGHGYLASHSEMMLIPVAADESVERVEIRWPSGHQDIHDGLPPGRECVVVEGDRWSVLNR